MSASWSWALYAECGGCGAGDGLQCCVDGVVPVEPCRGRRLKPTSDPATARRWRAQRRRKAVLNDVLGEKNAAAIQKIDRLLKHVEGNGGNRPTFTLPAPPTKVDEP